MYFYFLELIEIGFYFKIILFFFNIYLTLIFPQNILVISLPVWNNIYYFCFCLLS